MLNNDESFIKVRSAVLIILVQVITFGTGLYAGYKFISKPDNTQAVDLQNNYSQNIPQTPVNLPANNQEQPRPAQPTNQTPASSAECRGIKGNISSGKSKIYHLPGGAFYDRTDAEMCFESEQQAINAGFVKSSR